jgi:CheY-like chemotaxis protein
MKRFEKTKTSPYFQAAIGLTTLAVFGADLISPLGFTVWILYLVPIALCLYEWRPKLPLLVAALVSGLVVLGYLLSPPGSFSPAMARLNRLVGLVTIWVLASVVRRFLTAKLNLREQEWIRAGQRELSLRMQGEQSLAQLGDNILVVLCHYLESPVAVLYVAVEDARFRRQASYAAAGARPEAPESLLPGDSLLGQAIKERRIVRLDQLPADYLPISSALGRTASTHLVLVPAEVDGSVRCAMEFGFLHPIGRSDIDLLQMTAESVAVAVRSAQYRVRQAELLAQTQQQAEELQTQQEELRVANEELQEQSRALKASKSRLEGQQSELEQTNAELEQQAAELQHQRDAMARAQADLVEKADALERSNRYKSEFLANMSHELRTPLNSALILSKLLADNKEGNLTPEQVKFASTICSSGNDLLTLINDILDLSRIEAGRVEMRPEEVTLASVFASLKKTFAPLAAQKSLGLEFIAEENAPSAVTTDNLRLQQILRNLLSNAVKFTEQGQVSLRVSRALGGQIAFAVHDTGIGIPPDQHEAIFDAFHQADSSTSRKYGGTGLGLTISRELARRMGGTLTVRSEVGKGSVFTLALPLTPKVAGEPAPVPAPPRPPEPARKVTAPKPTAQTESVPKVADDRDSVTTGERSILVIEDDARFAEILRDLARELRFRCLVATTAGEGLQLAEQFVPSAILLDVHLPDLSGLGLLEQLKRNPATRHIPVHVASVADYTQQAFELGAVGYALKPVKRDQIVSAIARLEKKLEQKVRRILVVEDVAAQRESIEALLRREGVEIISVGRGQEALDLLRSNTFDCMVLDLILPDMSGYALLEKMAAGEAFSFPPVIVYTGRSLTRDEEAQLRKFASSIIIKGARSPERLLDEVSLFLHQVEANLPPEQQRILQAVRQRDAAFEGRTILVVEDDARNIFALSSILEPKGAKLLVARNGREAIDVLDGLAKPLAETVDLVLMDIMMPVMDGLAATREIRKRPEWKNLPIIALTAKAMPDDRSRCLEAGSNDYIAKPLDVDKLVSLVKVWLPK